MLAVDDAWENFINNTSPNNIINQEEKEETEKLNEVDIPKCSDIYISTQTKIAYLNKPINLNEVFWKIPVIPYQNENIEELK